MLDRTKLPRSFSVPYQGRTFDFTATNASDEAWLVLNVGRDAGDKRVYYANDLRIDRHAGQFHFSDDLGADIYALRSFAMKLNAAPAKLLSFACRFVGGLFGIGPKTVIIGGGDFGMGWNIGVLFFMVAILAVAATIGLYVVLPLLVLAAICFVLAGR